MEDQKLVFFSLELLARSIVPAIPTFFIYFATCYRPSISSQVIGTAVIDFCTNLCIGVFYSIFMKDIYADSLFYCFIFCFYFILIFVKIHSSQLFLYQLTYKPDLKNFFKETRDTIGCPPNIEFRFTNTPSGCNSPCSSREPSPINYQYGSWQNITPYPEIKYSENLRVTSTTSYLLTRSARQDLKKHEDMLNLKYAPKHKCVKPVFTCNDGANYYISNTSNKNSPIFRFISCSTAKLLYIFLIFFGYNLPIEVYYYSKSPEIKIQHYKYIGTKEDNLRADYKEFDTVAQDSFSTYVDAVSQDYSPRVN